jgi:hypothetical protein
MITMAEQRRLTRSLADFAKIVEIFDARGASFVSVTQQFKPTTSMGRLTLNVALSFAKGGYSWPDEVVPLPSPIRSSRSAKSNNSCWISAIRVCRASCLIFSAIA